VSQGIGSLNVITVAANLRMSFAEGILKMN
jgi:hypothetical protein